jgi:type VII secretion-associated serine protease mycosin
MRISSIRPSRRWVITSASLGLLLVGSAAVPAHAETIRTKQWHLDAMQAEDMWKTSTGQGVTVAVIDTGVDASHPDLQGQVVAGLDLAPGGGDGRTDHDGHGTGMAAVIAGTGKLNGGNGAFGLAPGAKILPIRVPDGGEKGSRQDQADAYQQPASEAIRFAADHNAKIINISQGVIAGSDQLTDAVKYALDKGALIFAGTGNDGDSDLAFPAATPGVVAVGAVDKNGKKTKVSQYGPQVDLVAPGEDIVASCTSETRVCESSGTSDATAIASASAALLWAEHPEWTNNQVLRVMLETAGRPKTGKRTDYVGYGVVRPRVALTTPVDPGPADEYPLSDFAASGSSSTPEPSKPAAGSEKDETQPPAASSSVSDDGGNTGLWIGLAVGAAVVLGGVAAGVMRSRRRGVAS